MLKIGIIKKTPLTDSFVIPNLSNISPSNLMENESDLFLLFTEDFSEEFILEICQQMPVRKLAYIGIKGVDHLKERGYFDVSHLYQVSESTSDFFDKLQQIFAEGQNTGIFVPNEAAILGEAITSYKRKSSYHLEFTVDTKDVWREALVWHRHPGNWMGGVQQFGFLYPNQSYTFKLFCHCELSIDMKIRLALVKKDGELRIFESTDLEFDVDIDDYETAQLQFLVRGTGSIVFNRILVARNRLGFGSFLPGDEVLDSDGEEEVLCYEIPGKNTQHAIISFTGALNHVPKFEYTSLAKYQYPVLLFCDFRARSGAFLLGKGLSSRFEEQVISRIKQFLDKYKLNPEQLIFNGYSMGAYPALLYGAQLRVGHIIASKPFVKLGKVSSDAQTAWKTDGTMLDARYYLMDRFNDSDTEILDLYFEKNFSKITSPTNVHLFEMTKDELAFDSMTTIRQILDSQNIVYRVEQQEGTHGEKIVEMRSFIAQVIESIQGEKNEFYTTI